MRAKPRHKMWEFDEKVWAKPDVIARLRAYYRDSLKYLDDQVARLVDCLKQKCIWENTIVVFTSDHGEMLCFPELAAVHLHRWQTRENAIFIHLVHAITGFVLIRVLIERPCLPGIRGYRAMVAHQPDA